MKAASRKTAKKQVAGLTVTTLFNDILDAKSIVTGGAPNAPQARKYIAATLQRCFDALVSADDLQRHLRAQEEAAADAAAAKQRLTGLLLRWEKS